MLSDSQLSTDTTEAHGAQKQFVGNDFLLGASGKALVLKAIFTSLLDPATGNCRVDHTDIEDHLQRFLWQEVTEQARSSVNLLLLRPCSVKGYRIDLFRPDTLRSSIPQGEYDTLGSGSEIVRSALQRDNALALFSKPQEMVDMLVAGENYLEAATRSLTVNSQFTVGMLHSGRAYILGDGRINPIYAPSAICSEWADVAAKYKRMIDHARLIRGEIREAQRALSKIQMARLFPDGVAAIAANQASVARNRKMLQGEIEEYFNWYDSVLCR